MRIYDLFEYVCMDFDFTEKDMKIKSNHNLKYFDKHSTLPHSMYTRDAVWFNTYVLV